MYLQRLYIGLNDKDLHEQIIKTESAKQAIRDILSNKYISYTVLEGEGVFLRESEQTIIIEYIYPVKELLIDREHINSIRNALNQETILQTIQEIEVQFI